MSEDVTEEKKGLDLSHEIATGRVGTLGSKLRLIAMLSWPAIMAQLSMILMEYIDASMVGSLGASPAASIGLVATTTWLFWGLGTATGTGYAVQVAHLVGAGRDGEARDVLRQGMVVVFGLAVVMALIGLAIAPLLPGWLGGNAGIAPDSTAYFAIFSASLPVLYMTFLTGSMLRCSGNMLVPGILNVVMCVLDVIFNWFLIFPTRETNFFGTSVMIPGADMGVTGAAVGSLLAEVCAGGYMIYYMLCRSDKLSHPARGTRRFWRVTRATVGRACHISWPLALERVVMCGAQILITAIVAPLGTAAIAANSFGITAESLCYMPGYGVADAATTLVGQSLGAGRRDLARSFGRISILIGMAVMGLLGVVMWVFASDMMNFFTPDANVVALGTMALRVEAWAEPMFGAAIVTYGVFVGAGYTVVPAVINFSCIWGVRLILSMLLAPAMGLFGIWLAMALELSVRGAVFLFCFIRGSWLRKALDITDTAPESPPVADDPFQL